MVHSTEQGRPIEPSMFRRVMGRFATRAEVVTVIRNGQATVMTVIARMSLSLDPPLILVSVRHASAFVEDTMLGRRGGINIVSQQQRELGPHSANRPEKDVEVHFDD